LCFARPFQRSRPVLCEKQQGRPQGRRRTSGQYGQGWLACHDRADTFSRKACASARIYRKARPPKDRLNTTAHRGTGRPPNNAIFAAAAIPVHVWSVDRPKPICHSHMGRKRSPYPGAQTPLGGGSRRGWGTLAATARRTILFDCVPTGSRPKDRSAPARSPRVHGSERPGRRRERPPASSAGGIDDGRSMTACFSTAKDHQRERNNTEPCGGPVFASI